MAETSKIEWTDATFQGKIGYGKQNWHHESRCEAVRGFSGSLRSEDQKRGEVVYALQGVASSLGVRGRPHEIGRANGAMHRLSERCGKVNLSTKAAPKGRQALCPHTMRRQRPSTTSRELPSAHGGYPRPERACLHGLRAPRIGGAA